MTSGVIIHMTYLGDGQCEARGALDRRLLNQNYKVGQRVTCKTTVPRSRKQDAYFFALLNQVFANLPEEGELHFADSEHLRAWIIYRTGFCDIFTWPRTDLDDRGVKMLRRMHNRHLFFEFTADMAFIFRPRSFTEITSKDFSKLIQTLKELAPELIPGIDVDALDAQAKRNEI